MGCRNPAAGVVGPSASSGKKLAGRQSRTAVALSLFPARPQDTTTMENEKVANQQQQPAGAVQSDHSSDDTRRESRLKLVMRACCKHGDLSGPSDARIVHNSQTTRLLTMAKTATRRRSMQPS